MEEHLGALVTAAIILFQLVSWGRRILGRSRDRPAAPAPAGRPGRREQAVAAPPPAGREAASEGLQAAVAREVGRVARQVGEGEALLAELPALRDQLWGAGPTGRVLVEVLDERVSPALEQAVQRGRALSKRLGSAPLPIAIPLLQSPEALAPLGEIAEVRQYADVLRQMAVWRSDPRLGRLLADADAIAASLLDPIQRMAGVQGFVFPQQRPICAPADRDAEALWLGLLPEGYPVIFVPDDFSEDLYRQASLPHEVGHLLWLRVPGLADELRAVTDLRSSGQVLEWDGQQVRGAVGWPFGAWLPELFADAVCVLMFGPAGLRGLTHSFASPDAPAAVITAHLDGQGYYDEHPPAHLRVHLAGALLHRMGFDQEIRPILDAWDAVHGHPDALVLPTRDGPLVSVPFTQLRAFGADVMERIYTAPLATLDGIDLQDLPGLEMSPGMWAKVRRHAAELAEGRPFHEEGRVALASAIEARALHPDRAARIEAGLLRAVLGRDADDRLAPDAHYNRGLVPRGAHGKLAHQVLDGLLLADILVPRRVGSRR